MKRWLTGVGICVLAFCLPAPAMAAGGLPVPLLDKARLGLICWDTVDTNAAVDCWLNKHPSIAQSMFYAEANYTGNWTTWPASSKDDFHTYFNQMVLFYRLGMPLNFPQPLPDIIPREGPPIPYFGNHLKPADGRTEYLLLVGNSIAAELTAAFPWSIVNSADAWRLLNMSEILGTYMEPPNVPEAGYYPNGASPGLPAPPGYTLTFFKNNQLLGADEKDTLGRVFMWARKLMHFFVEDGVTIEQSYSLFWGPDALPIEEAQLVEGTTYTGPAGPWFGHWTLGCHGTMDFMKRVLQAVNIPVRVWNASGHATPIFPDVDLQLSHGDDPYNRTGVVTPLAGFASPQPLEYFLSPAQFNALCDPNWPDPNWCSHKVGITTTLVGLKYGSDELMKLHCQDVAAGKSHIDSSLLGFVKFYWPEKSDADIVTMLESQGAWTLLDAKIAVKGCS